jgi:hypothetical protein
MLLLLLLIRLWLPRWLRRRQKSSDNITHFDIMMSEYDQTPSVRLNSEHNVTAIHDRFRIGHSPHGHDQFHSPSIPVTEIITSVVVMKTGPTRVFPLTHMATKGREGKGKDKVCGWP